MRSPISFAALTLSAVLVAGATPSRSEASWLSELLHRAFDDRDYGRYYGRGGHDNYPHWHDTYTPYGVQRWYGRGPHDDRPHEHRYGPRSYRGYSQTPWGPTRSYYPRYPNRW